MLTIELREICKFFPYTTLFRSTEAGGRWRTRPVVGRWWARPGRWWAKPDDGGSQGPPWAGRGQRAGQGGDRKSTRLNSSHVAISYAVFCLKKKKKNTINKDQES